MLQFFLQHQMTMKFPVEQKDLTFQIALSISNKSELTSFLGMFSIPHFSHDKGYRGQSGK